MAPQKKAAQTDPQGFGPPEDNPPGFGAPESAATPPDLNAHAPVPTPGIVSRFGEAVGVPTTWEGTQQMGQGMDLFHFPNHPVIEKIANAAAGPAGTAVTAAKNFGSNLAQQGQEMVNSISGAPEGQKGKAAAEAVPKFILGGPLAPVGGGAINSLAEDLSHGNLSASAGDILGTAANMLMLGKAGGPGREGQLNKLTAAIGPKAQKSLANTIDLLNTTKESTGVPVSSVSDFKTLVNKTKDNINTEYKGALNPYANMQIAAHPISDAIKTLITPDMDFTAAGRAEKQHIINTALEYEKPWSIGALDSKRSRISADLASHNTREPVGRYTAEKGNTDLAIDSKILQTLKDEIYPRVDVMASKPSGYFENLKQNQSNLIQMESLLNKRIEELTGKTRESKGTAPMSRLHGGVSVSTSMTPHGYVGNLTRLIHAPNLLAEANSLAKGAMSSGPIAKTAKGIVLSYPARVLSADQPEPWWTDPR